MKKILLGLGSITAVSAAALVAVSCEFKDVDPNKIWEEYMSFEVEGDFDTAEYNNVKDQIMTKAMEFNKEAGRRWEIHLTMSQKKDTGAQRVWTGTVAESSFGKTKLEVQNDVTSKLNEFRDWTGAETEHYESFIYEEDRDKAKQIFDAELAYARTLKLASHITIHVWNHKEGLEAVFDNQDVRISPYLMTDTIFEHIPNINSVYSFFSQI